MGKGEIEENGMKLGNRKKVERKGPIVEDR